jgi:hypothetical protein
MVAAGIIRSAPRPTCLFSPSIHRASKSKRSVLAVARAVAVVMQRELGGDALARWQGLIDAELGEQLFGRINILKHVSRPMAKPTPQPPPSPSKSDTTPPSVPSTKGWAPTRPKLAALLLKAFESDQQMADGQRVTICVQAADGSDLFKIMSKRSIAWVMANHRDAVLTSGEFSSEHLASEARLLKVMARAGSDVLAFIHATALGMCDEADGDVMLSLQGTDQRLSGINTRGSGVVFCDRGRALFERALSETRARLHTI